MRPDRTGDRQHSFADLLILLVAATLTLATWAYLSGTTGVPVWKCYISVAITLLLALATLTRNPNWAAAIRGLTGIWLIAAPYLLRVHDVGPGPWAYLGAGALVSVLAAPGLMVRVVNRTLITV